MRARPQTTLHDHGGNACALLRGAVATTASAAAAEAADDYVVTLLAGGGGGSGGGGGGGGVYLCTAHNNIMYLVYILLYYNIGLGMSIIAHVACFLVGFFFDLSCSCNFFFLIFRLSRTLRAAAFVRRSIYLTNNTGFGFIARATPDGGTRTTATTATMRR